MIDDRLSMTDDRLSMRFEVTANASVSNLSEAGRTSRKRAVASPVEDYGQACRR